MFIEEVVVREAGDSGRCCLVYSQDNGALFTPVNLFFIIAALFNDQLS